MEEAWPGRSGRDWYVSAEPKAAAIPSFVWGRSQPLSVPQLPSLYTSCEVADQLA